MDAKTGWAAVTSTLVAETIFHPLDTLCTLQQTSTNFRYLLKPAQYWKGLTPTLVFSVPAFSVNVIAYRQSKRMLDPYLGSSIANYATSGLITELVTSLIATPMEVIKGRMQITTQSTSYYTLCQKIFAQQGFRGFYRGYWTGLAVFIPDSIIGWTTYELAKHQLLGATSSGLQVALAAGTSTILATTATNFFSVVRTRQQLAIAEEITRLRPTDHLSVRQVAVNLINEVGWFRALFKSLHVRLLHYLPVGMVSMVVLEYMAPDH